MLYMPLLITNFFVHYLYVYRINILIYTNHVREQSRYREKDINKIRTGKLVWRNFHNRCSCNFILVSHNIQRVFFARLYEMYPLL